MLLLSTPPSINITANMTDKVEDMDNDKKQDSFIGPDDVLLGRGGATNNHDGNRKFRVLVAENQPFYLQARKRDKVVIARQIVSSIQGNGGRFLKRGNDDSEWVQVSDKRAQEKTSQALREGLDVRNNTIRPNKMIKSSVRRNSESSSSQIDTAAGSTAPNSSSKPSTVVTGKVVSPKTPVDLARGGGRQPLENAAKRNLSIPGLKEEPSEPFFLLYQPPPLSQQVIDQKCEV